MNRITKFDWIEGGLLLLVALCLTIPQYVESTTTFILVIIGTIMVCLLPLYYILTYKNYNFGQSDSTKGFSWLMYWWSVVFKCLVLLTFVLSFYELHWVGDISTRSTIIKILFIANRLIMIPYFIICMYKRAYKEASVAFVYDLYYQLLGPALTFFMFH